MNKTLLASRQNGANGKQAPSKEREEDQKTRRRVPPLAVGLGIGTLAFIAFLALTPSLPRSTSVLVLRAGVAEGSVIGPSQLRVLSTPVAKGVATVSAATEQQVLGSRATASLPAGSLLAPGDYSSSASRQDTVGLSLKPGQFPPNLVPGDHVIAVSQSSASAPMASGDVAGNRAVVLSVHPSTGNPDGAVVALGVAPTQASALALAGASSQLSLVVVP